MASEAPSGATGPTRVVCLGNELVSDDGVGIRVGRILRLLDLPSSVQVDLIPNLGFGMLDLLAECERLILVDAMRTGRAPGDCVELDLLAVQDLASTPYACHGLGLPEVVYVAREMSGGRSPSQVIIVGIEAQVLDRFDFAITEEVARGIPVAVDKVLTLVGASEELRTRGRKLAIERQHWVPSPEDLREV